ncbi:MAG: hypothetical protein ACLR6B_02270 [Blautia sp.]
MKKKDIDAVYEENPAEDATAEEKASGKRKKQKEENKNGTGFRIQKRTE